MSRTLVVACALLALSAACKKQPADEEAAKMGEERLNLLSNPSVYLEATDLQFNDDAEETDTWQLIAVTVLNKSHFMVRDIEGDVTWLDGEGKKLGTSSIAVKGFIIAGNTNTFSLSAANLVAPPRKGVVASASISFVRASLVN